MKSLQICRMANNALNDSEAAKVLTHIQQMTSLLISKLEHHQVHIDWYSSINIVWLPFLPHDVWLWGEHKKTMIAR